MYKKYLWLVALWMLCAVPGFAQLQKFCIPGIAPTHHVTSMELSPATIVIDNKGGVSIDTLTAKMYYAFNPDYNVGVEVPFSRYEAPGDSHNGLGDVLLSAQAVQHSEYFDFGVKLDSYLPTANDDSLGTGKWQLAPAVFAVYPVNPNFFVAAGYKQTFSVAGDGSRDHINYGRVRVLFSYMSDAQWWITFDPQYYINYKHAHEAELVWESELGVMVNPGTALYIKPGAHWGGNWRSRDWTLSMGFKILYL